MRMRSIWESRLQIGAYLQISSAYEVVAGIRRLRALRDLKWKEKIPCSVVGLDDKEADMGIDGESGQVGKPCLRFM